MWANIVSATLIAVLAFVVRRWVDDRYARLGITASDAGFSYFTLVGVMAVYATTITFLPFGVLLIVAWSRQDDRRTKPRNAKKWPDPFQRPRWVPDQFALIWLLLVMAGLSVAALALATVVVLGLDAVGVLVPAVVLAGAVAVVLGARATVRGVRELVTNRWMRRTLACFLVAGVLLPLQPLTSSGSASYRERFAAFPGPFTWSKWLSTARLTLPLPHDFWVMLTPDGQKHVVAVLHWDSWLNVIEPCAQPPYRKQRYLATTLTMLKAPDSVTYETLCGSP